MKIARTHRKGATSLVALVAAAFLPGLAQGEVATAQILPEAAPVVQEAIEAPAPTVNVAPVVADAEADAAEEAKPFQEGVASYYGEELAGNRTASGERFNPNALTAAHRTLPMGTKLRVTNKANGKSVVVRVNDRGPFAKARVLDLSRAAAQQISMIRSGTARVSIARLG